MDEGLVRFDVVLTAGLTALAAEKRERGQGREIFMSEKELRVREGRGEQIQIK